MRSRGLTPGWPGPRCNPFYHCRRRRKESVIWFLAKAAGCGRGVELVRDSLRRLLQYLVMGLGLELRGRQRRFKVGPQKGHAVDLAGIEPQPHPNEMNIVRHQAIARAEQPLAGGGMQHQLAKQGVEGIREPASRAIQYGESPVNDRVALVVFAGQSRQVVGARTVGIRQMLGEIGRRFHGAENTSDSLRRFLQFQNTPSQAIGEEYQI